MLLGIDGKVGGRGLGFFWGTGNWEEGAGGCLQCSPVGQVSAPLCYIRCVAETLLPAEKGVGMDQPALQRGSEGPWSQLGRAGQLLCCSGVTAPAACTCCLLLPAARALRSAFPHALLRAVETKMLLARAAVRRCTYGRASAARSRGSQLGDASYSVAVHNEC